MVVFYLFISNYSDNICYKFVFEVYIIILKDSAILNYSLGLILAILILDLCYYLLHARAKNILQKYKK